MFDHVELKAEIRCPTCNAKVKSDWQTKDLVCQFWDFEEGEDISYVIKKLGTDITQLKLSQVCALPCRNYLLLRADVVDGKITINQKQPEVITYD